MGEPDLVGKGLKAVRADVRVIFPPLYPLMVDQGARGHGSLQSVILAERLLASGSPVTGPQTL